MADPPPIATVLPVATPTAAGAAPSGISGELAALYVGLLVLVALLPMLIDLGAAYWFAGRTRRLLIDKAAGDRLSLPELRLILQELQASPPGIPGLARSTMALTVIVILGVAIFHLLVMPVALTDQTMQAVTTVLTLLSGLLAAITGFYFGGKATEAGQRTVEAGPAPTSTVPDLVRTRTNGKTPHVPSEKEFAGTDTK
jgi:hypothetical protein